MNDYSVWRIIPSKPGCIDFCGTVYAGDLASAKAIARLMYPVSGGDYLDVEEDQDADSRFVRQDANRLRGLSAILGGMMEYCEDYRDPDYDFNIADGDDEDKWECAYPGKCLMPSPDHMRDECYTVEDAEAYYAEMLSEDSGEDYRTEDWRVKPDEVR